MSYALVSDVDLSRHRDVSKELRDWRGRWRLGPTGGSHLPSSSEDRWKISETTTATEIAGHITQLTEQVAQADPSSTEYEHAMARLQVHVEHLAVRVKAEAVSHEPRSKRVAEKKPVKGTAEYGTSVGEILSTDAMANFAINAGIKVAAVAGGMLGGHEASRWGEAFAHIAESPIAEAGIVAIMALLLSALATRIRKALRDRRDRKIAKARIKDPIMEGFTDARHRDNAKPLHLGPSGEKSHRKAKHAAAIVRPERVNHRATPYEVG